MEATGKRLLYLLSIGVTMGLALWLTDGLRHFAASNHKPLSLFVWGIVIFAS